MKKKTLLLHLCLVVLVGLACYSNTLNSPLLFDDIPKIKNEPLIRDLGRFLSLQTHIPANGIFLAFYPVKKRS